MALDIRPLYGPILLGICIGMILYGVFVVQTYLYYVTYKKDKLWIKLLVLYLLVVESANTGFDIYILYEPLIQRYALPEVAMYFPTLFPAQPITVVAISTPVQLFFAWRIWLIAGLKVVPVIISALSTVSFACGIWTGYRIANIRLYARGPELHLPALVWFLSSCAADILITVILVYSLHKKKTGFVATDDIISKIIRMTVQTGLMTTICAVLEIILFMIYKHATFNFILDFSLPRIYSNSLLSSLNARASLSSSHGAVEYHSTPLQIATGSTRQTDAGVSAMAYSPNTGLKTGNSVQHLISPFDLGTGKGLDRSPDVEYGIKITKVIESKEDSSNQQSPTQ